MCFLKILRLLATCLIDKRVVSWYNVLNQNLLICPSSLWSAGARQLPARAPAREFI